jgi:GT2 family glycosyltransferase
VLVLNYNGRQHLDDCLASLAALDVFDPDEPGSPRDPAVRDDVYVVDNGSTDGSLAHVRDRFPWVRTIDNGANLGFARGYDAAIATVDAEWVALLNGDTRVEPGWLSALHHTAAAHPRAWAVASRVLSWDGERLDFVGADTYFTGHAWQRGLGEPAAGRTWPERELLFGCAASLLVRRRTFIEAGGFDPDYFAFFEDVDLGWRLALAGHETWLSPDAVTHHKLHGTFGDQPAARTRFLCERNALASVFKNFADDRMGVLLLASAALAFLRAWASSSQVRPAVRPYLTTDSLAHLLAVADLARLRPSLAARRAAVQAARRRGDADLQPLFGDLAHPPTALGLEYRGPLETLTATLGLATEGFARSFPVELNLAAEAAAFALAGLCLEVTAPRFRAEPFLSRGYDLDWEHALDAGGMARLRDAAAAVAALLASDFGLGAVATFAASLDRLDREGHKPLTASGRAPSGDVWLPTSLPRSQTPPAPSDAELAGATVTIVIRTKDRPEPLARALASVAAQHYARLEVVVVNDGGADVSPVIAAFRGELVVVNLRRTEGVGRTRAAQAGLEAATGEFVNFLDDDDELLPHHLRSLVETQRRTGARVVHSDVVMVAVEPDGDGGTRTVERGRLGGPLDRSRLFFESTLPLMSVLMDRELALAAGGFDPALDYFEDWDLFLRLARRASFAHCPEVTARYLVAPELGHGGGTTGAHRWPHLAAFFERHKDEISGADWARFYRAQVESVRLHARELEQRLEAAENVRRRAESTMAALDRSRVFRLARRVRHMLGRR